MNTLCFILTFFESLAHKDDIYHIHDIGYYRIPQIKKVKNDNFVGFIETQVTTCIGYVNIQEAKSNSQKDCKMETLRKKTDNRKRWIDQIIQNLWKKFENKL